MNDDKPVKAAMARNVTTRDFAGVFEGRGGGAGGETEAAAAAAARFAALPFGGTTTSGTSATGVAAETAGARAGRAIANTTMPIAMLIAPASMTVPGNPNAGMNTNALASTPNTAPRLFRKYRTLIS